MFPYNSAVGFIIIQILKALALIKAGRLAYLGIPSTRPVLRKLRAGGLSVEQQARQQASNQYLCLEVLRRLAYPRSCSAKDQPGILSSSQTRLSQTCVCSPSAVCPRCSSRRRGLACEAAAILRGSPDPALYKARHPSTYSFSLYLARCGNGLRT